MMVAENFLGGLAFGIQEEIFVHPFVVSDVPVTRDCQANIGNRIWKKEEWL
jgi:hypothetical protein